MEGVDDAALRYAIANEFTDEQKARLQNIVNIFSNKDEPNRAKGGRLRKDQQQKMKAVIAWSSRVCMYRSLLATATSAWHMRRKGSSRMALQRAASGALRCSEEMLEEKLVKASRKTTYSFPAVPAPSALVGVP